MKEIPLDNAGLVDLVTAVFKHDDAPYWLLDAMSEAINDNATVDAFDPEYIRLAMKNSKPKEKAKPAKADKTSGLAVAISEVLNAPNLPTDFYNGFKGALTDVYNEVSKPKDEFEQHENSSAFLEMLLRKSGGAE